MAEEQVKRIRVKQQNSHDSLVIEAPIVEESVSNESIAQDACNNNGAVRLLLAEVGKL